MNTIFVVLPQYLRDWCINEFDNVPAIRFPNGSAENAVLKAFLRRRRATDPVPELNQPENSIKIILPEFKGMPTEYFNVLPQKGIEALISVITARFDVALFCDIFPLVGIANIDLSLWAWMQKVGIEETETNFHAVKKRFQRRVTAYRNNESQRARRKAKKIRE